MAKRPPTDFKLLKAIYERHHAEYVEVAATGQVGRIMVPVDIPAVADDLGSDQDTVFGRLYYHLDPLYAEPKREGQPQKFFFTPKAGDMVNAVNFPHLEAVLAGLWDERNRNRWTFWISVGSVAISIAALTVSVFL